MKIRYVVFKGLFVILALLLSANFVLAKDVTAKRAEKLMIWQLEAIRNGDYQRFIEHGNKAFKEFMNAYSFDTFKQLKGENIAKGYKLKYLGAKPRTEKG